MDGINVWEDALSIEQRLALGGSQHDDEMSTVWNAVGSADEIAIVMAVLDEADATYTTATGRLLIRSHAAPKQTGPLSWKVKLEYTPEEDSSNDDKPDVSTWTFDFDTTGGTQKMLQALEEVCSAKRKESEADPDDGAPDLELAIGWDGKKVNGVEVVVPKLEFTIHAYYDPADITATFMKEHARATGKMNNDAFIGFDAGELLYLGATGSGVIPSTAGPRVKPQKVDHKFAASENIPADVVLSAFLKLHCMKRGWDYLDVFYEKHAGEEEILVRPKYARILRTYPLLGYGGFFAFG